MSAVETEFVQYGFQDVHTEYGFVSREVNYIAYFVQCVGFKDYYYLVD